MFNRLCCNINPFMLLLSSAEDMYLNSESHAGKKIFNKFQCQLENFGIVELWC